MLKTLGWFKLAGNTSGEFTVIHSIFHAWDNWNKEKLKVWDKESHKLEEEALNILTDEQIDKIFELVSETIGDDLYDKLCAFEENNELLDESGLENEIIDFVLRDTSWACIEVLLNKDGFFTKSYRINKSGRWACSWDGIYPDGRFVIM